ncbi:hypothetical protein HPP92_014302 [Vanilla planifolia]|uniref:Uncharacterized protein n=1 Tax=Vanilla planifolia TaxID=51239 RepID=A0A835UZF1_VANPL|nr:hypothetical protein HPP92_014302 [Vanilla planifolia]
MEKKERKRKLIFYVAETILKAGRGFAVLLKEETKVLETWKLWETPRSTTWSPRCGAVLRSKASEMARFA